MLLRNNWMNKMEYAELYNNIIVKIHNSLPINWKNISNFYKLSDNEIRDLTWAEQSGYSFLPCIDDVIPEHNPAIQRCVLNEYIVQQNQVLKTWSIINLSQEEIDEFNRRVWTPYEFLLLLTSEERSLIRSFAKTDDNIADFLQLLQAATQIINDDPVTIAGMNYAVSVGIFSQQRKNEILGFE